VVEAFVSLDAMVAALAVDTCGDRPILASEKAVLVCLASYADKFARQAWPAVGTIAEQTRLSRRTVQRALRELEACGLIYNEVGATNRTSTTYTLYVGLPYLLSRQRRGVMVTPDPSGSSSLDLDLSSQSEGRSGSGSGDTVARPERIETSRRRR